MTITQRDMDLARLEAELRMQSIFDEWRESFLAERFQQSPRRQTAVNPPLISEGEESGTVR